MTDEKVILFLIIFTFIGILLVITMRSEMSYFFDEENVTVPPLHLTSWEIVTWSLAWFGFFALIAWPITLMSNEGVEA